MPDGVVPDARDGLTPVCRRALLTLHAARERSPAYRQSALAVDAVLRGGRVDGGRRAIYGELLRMARDFELRHPLVDGRGDLGYIDGEGAASADYTELRLGALGGELLRGLGERVAGTAGARPGEAVLPTRIPNLLANGSFSVATRDASSIPPHNLSELAGATIASIDDPGIDTAGLMEHILGPDFPTGAIVSADGLREAYDSGRGAITIRARTHVESGPRRTAIVVTELPFMVTTGGRGGVLAEIRRGARAGRIAGVQEILDESGARDGLRIVVALAPGAPAPEVVLEQLHAHTRLRTTFALRIVALVDGAARTLSLREAIARFVEHRRDVVARATGLRSDERVLELVRDDLRDLAEQHGDERRSEIAVT